MAGLVVLFALQVTFISTVLAQRSLSLEMDGEQYGVFSSLVQAHETPGTVTLEQGWVSSAFLEAWSPGLTDGGALEAGRREFDDACVGRRVEVVQTLATGERRRVRSWTLIDACPVWCQVEAQEGDKISVTSLTFRVQGVGVAH